MTQYVQRHDEEQSQQETILLHSNIIMHKIISVFLKKEFVVNLVLALFQIDLLFNSRVKSNRIVVNHQLAINVLTWGRAG